MSAKTQRIIGWVLSGIISAFLIVASGVPKLTGNVPAEMLDKLGFTADTIFKIGIVEVLVAVLFVIPRTGFIGAILVTGYLGGAICTHVRIGDTNFIMPIVMGILAWVALGLRQPEIFRLAIGSSKS
jgi:DoxX-like family